MKINEEAREELLNEVTGLSDEEINRNPSGDEWSIRQVLEHLYVFELEVIKSVQEELDKGVVKERPIHLAVNRDIKVEAPSNVKPSETFATFFAN
ncbi:DinB family protein [Pseudogracilibacillus sp. SO30301A]|uniref:DinB family protein n=1 Tax=Pseudogracilibacillus sp. SO30301A TaxID=3098291 RepID=UPI00300E295D